MLLTPLLVCYVYLGRQSRSRLGRSRLGRDGYDRTGYDWDGYDFDGLDKHNKPKTELTA